MISGLMMLNELKVGWTFTSVYCLTRLFDCVQQFSLVVLLHTHDAVFVPVLCA